MPAYPGPISPRCDPDLLGRLDHDPFGVMPKTFARRPHLLVSPELLELARDRLKSCSWAQACYQRLLTNCFDKDAVLNKPPDALADVKQRGALLQLASRNALAFLLSRTAGYRETALKAFRILAEYGAHATPTANGGLIADSVLSESHALVLAGRTYDLLAAADLANADDRLFRAFLLATRAASNACQHYACGNINTWSQTGRLNVALALEDPQGIHEALYGCAGSARWRYGLIHNLRHDVLADGMHWERTPGYHYYTLMALNCALDAAFNSGIDLWHKELPMLQQDDLADSHRAYGPLGVRTVKAAYDAPFFLTFGNGDLSQLSDSGLVNLRGVWIWGIIYNKAYEAYGDPKYAWLLNRMESDYKTRDYPGVPMPLQTDRGDIDFVRLKHVSYPCGRWSLARDTNIGFSGRQTKGSSCLPTYGAAVMRVGTDAASPGAFVYFGPHAAGHQHPAALHADIHIGGLCLTDAPRMKDYNDPLYLTWARTTVAGNTVVVDEQSMFPYDFSTDSIFECDRWRDNISDGELLAFSPGKSMASVRVRNVNVYPGVVLDRTLVVSREGVLDVYRVTANRRCQFDYVWHCVGPLPVPAGARPVSLGKARGYMHLTHARALALNKGRSLEWGCEGQVCRCALAGGAGKQLILADDPPICEVLCLGEFKVIRERKTLIQRIKSRNACFATFWSVGALPTQLWLKKGRQPGDWIVEGLLARRKLRWVLPASGPVSR